MPCLKHSRLARSRAHFRRSLFSPLSHSLLHPPGALLLQAHDLLRRPDSLSHLRNKIKRPRTVVERLSPPGYRFAPICGARIFLPSVLLRAKIRPLHETRTSSSAPGSDARLSPTSHARRTHNPGPDSSSHLRNKTKRPRTVVFLFWLRGWDLNLTASGL